MLCWALKSLHFGVMEFNFLVLRSGVTRTVPLLGKDLEANNEYSRRHAIGEETNGRF
jgi:hypothetical protein